MIVIFRIERHDAGSLRIPRCSNHIKRVVGSCNFTFETSGTINQAKLGIVVVR